MANGVHTLHLSDVMVEFPFQPYPCQLAYMEKVIQALQKSTNAILESPTGTGKTLCLLCAALGWREDALRKVKQQHGTMVEGELLDPWDTPALSDRVVNIPKIIYASRTHSQLTQVIHELKNTRYRPKVAIIGSREQLCIHGEVSKKDTNTEKVHLCRAKVKNHSCFYYNNTDVRRLKGVESVMDIEDLVLVGSRQKMCPYYLARELKSEADVVFLPYNYVLDIKTRQMHGVDVEGAIVILDEAHNIERVCEDSSSFDLTSADIAQCIGDIDHILKHKLDHLDSPEEGEGEEDLQDYLNLKEFFLTVEKTLDGISFKNDDKREIVKPGSYIFEFFEVAGLTCSTYGVLMDQCSKAISYLTTDSRSVHRNGNNLQKFVDSIKIIFSPVSPGSTGQSHSHHYKVHIKAEEDHRKDKKSDAWTAPTMETAKKEIRTLGYWCFSPGHAMANLAGQGVRSVILTSGTLSPLESFSSELQIEFPIRYEGPHVISERQILVGVVSKGCDGVSLNSSYANRSSLSYQTSLGNTLVNFSRSVPHGLLVFFPSYPVMNACVETWRESGIMQRIELNKPVFLEPRRKVEFNMTMNAFYERIGNPDNNGAAFFAVCRGKVSEGLDFANMNGRGVVITGLPYPPRMDPKVTLKIQHLKDTNHLNGLDGEEWYRQQASRAVNQAVGRVIRHKLDYGAILLCDERFAYSNAVNQLPQWIRPHVKTYDKFGLIQRDLNLFFKNTAKEFGPAVPAVEPSAGCSEDGTGKCGADSSSYHLPVVMRNFKRSRGYEEALRLAQDASVVDIHLPSMVPKIPQASLNRVNLELRKEASSKSLLSSLAKCEDNTKSVDLCTPPQPMQSTPTVAPSFSGTIMEEISSRHQVTTEQSSTSSRVPRRTLVLSKDKEAAKMATVQGYVKEVKSFLSDDGFQKFKKIMFHYRKKSDINMLTQSLKDLFERPSLFHLLEGMFKFILKEHKDIYSSFYHEFTGRSLERVCEGGVKRGALDRVCEDSRVKRGALDGVCEGGVKRGAMINKDQPKVKVKKTERPVKTLM